MARASARGASPGPSAVGLSICNDASRSPVAVTPTTMGAGGGGTGGARRTDGGESAAPRRICGGGSSGVGFVGRGEEGTEEGGAGEEDAGCVTADMGGDSGFVVDGKASRRGDCGLAVGGMTVGGFGAPGFGGGGSACKGSVGAALIVAGFADGAISETG